MDCHALLLELWWFLLPFNANILEYLNFNSENIWEAIRLLIENNFLLKKFQMGREINQ